MDYYDGHILKGHHVLEREVATLVNEYKPAGKYEFEFDATKLRGGVYFYRMQERGTFSSNCPFRQEKRVEFSRKDKG